MRMGIGQGATAGEEILINKDSYNYSVKVNPCLLREILTVK